MEPLKQIGDIQVFAEIHRGATTMVYKGYQPALERFVLLKVLRLEFAGDESVSARFEEEAKITARIHHPNVVPIYEFGRVGDWSYFAAEFVDGLDLRHLIARQSLPPLLACFVVQEVAKGLKAAHDINILHKDIKPSNVLISNRGEVKLTDFGMADIRESAQEQIEGTASGTLPYFSPEQILGEPVGKPSDIFALGATFYEMLTGEQAFQGQQESEFLDAIVNFDPVPFLEGQKNIAPELVAICRKMLKKKAAERYRDCGALLADLNAFGENTGLKLGSKHLARYLEDPASAVTIGTLPEEEPHPYRRRVAAYVASLFLAAGVLFAGYLSLKGDRTPSSNVNDLASARIADSLTAKVDSSSTAVSREEEEPDLTPPEPVVQRVAAVPPPKAETLAQDTLVSSPRETAVAQEEADRPPSPGFLQVSCAPWAVVFIDDDSVGVTPLPDSLRFAPGEHNLVLRNPDFPEYATTVEIKSDEVHRVVFSFWETVGLLELDISPWAVVYVDGARRDTIPPQKHPLIVTPGKHQLSLENPDLGVWKTELEVVAGETKHLRFNLRNLLTN